MPTTTENMTPEQFKAAFDQYRAQCNGSESFHSHFLPGVIFTDGVKWLADTAGAYWLIDAIASYQRDKKLTRDPMLHDYQIWQLDVDLAKKQAVLTCKADTDRDVVIRQQIKFTDFPSSKVRLTVERGSMIGNNGQPVACMVVMLPEER